VERTILREGNLPNFYHSTIASYDSYLDSTLAVKAYLGDESHFTTAVGYIVTLAGPFVSTFVKLSHIKSGYYSPIRS